MKYTVVFSCGHSKTVELFGSHKDRQRKIEWYESEGLCSECYKAKKEQEQKEQYQTIEEKTGVLPDLVGTERQVAWANKLRLNAIEDIDSCVAELECSYKGRTLKFTEEDLRKDSDYILSVLKKTDGKYSSQEECINKKKKLYKNVKMVNSDNFHEVIDLIKHNDSAKFWIESQYTSWKDIIYSEYYKKSAPEKPAPAVLVEVTVPYALYKKQLHSYKTKEDSYDKEDKTIVIFVEESKVQKVQDVIISDREAHEKEKAEDEKHIVAVKYADYKNGVFAGRIKKDVYDSYNRRDKTVKAIVRTDEDMAFVKDYYDTNKKKIERREKRADFKNGIIGEYEIVPDVIDVNSISEEIPEELKNV